jgi:hypothetical protein
MICLTDWCVVYWHIWQEDYVVFFYLPHSLSFDLQNCFVNKQIIDLILFLFLSFIKVDNFFVYKVILQNVPEKNGKNDSGVFICINMWGNFREQKWQSGFGNVYLHIQTYWYFHVHFSYAFENHNQNIISCCSCHIVCQICTKE